MPTSALIRFAYLPQIMCNQTNSHPVILTDIRNGRILVVDLDENAPLAQPLWEWYPTPEQGWRYTTQDALKEALSDARVRWSDCHRSPVVLFTGARGSVGMIAYPGGECLWEAMVGVSPHAIELLPNGDVVVAASGGSEGQKGAIHYLKLEDGTYTQSWVYGLYGAHGVVYDPKEAILWVSGTNDVLALTLGGEQIPDRGATIPCGYGHDLMQDLCDPDILWVSPSPVVYQFSKSRNELMESFPNADVIHPLLRAKGIASFADGVVVWVAYGHHTSSEHPDHFSALRPETGVITYTDESAGFNKARVFSERYI